MKKELIWNNHENKEIWTKEKIQASIKVLKDNEI